MGPCTLASSGGHSSQLQGSCWPGLELLTLPTASWVALRCLAWLRLEL